MGGDLTEKDIYCIARIIQGAIYEHNHLFGCWYCRYQDECGKTMETEHRIHYDEIKRKLGKITGLYFGLAYNGDPSVRDKYWLDEI